MLSNIFTLVLPIKCSENTPNLHETYPHLIWYFPPPNPSHETWDIIVRTHHPSLSKSESFAPLSANPVDLVQNLGVGLRASRTESHPTHRSQSVGYRRAIANTFSLIHSLPNIYIYIRPLLYQTFWPVFKYMYYEIDS